MGLKLPFQKHTSATWLFSNEESVERRGFGRLSHPLIKIWLPKVRGTLHPDYLEVTVESRSEAEEHDLMGDAVSRMTFFYSEEYKWSHTWLPSRNLWHVEAIHMHNKGEWRSEVEGYWNHHIAVRLVCDQLEAAEGREG